MVSFMIDLRTVPAEGMPKETMCSPVEEKGVPAAAEVAPRFAMCSGQDGHVVGSRLHAVGNPLGSCPALPMCRPDSQLRAFFPAILAF